MALDDKGLGGLDTVPTPETELTFGDISFTLDSYNSLAGFLRDELTRSLSETESYRNSISMWRMFVDPSETSKSFPWPGSSSVFVPIPRIILDAVKSAVKQQILRQKRLFIAEITDPEVAGVEEGQEFEVQEAFAEFLHKKARDRNGLDLERVLDEWLEEIFLTGIGALKLVVENDVRQVKVRGGETVELSFRLGPRLMSVPTDTWVWPAGPWRSVQEMPWCGNWVEMTPAALAVRAREPYNYKNTARVSRGSATIEKSVGTSQREEATRQFSMSPMVKLFEIALLWDKDSDGVFHDFLVTYELKSSTIMRVIYNPAGDGLKNYEVEVGSPRSGTIMGRGIIEPIVQPVRGINTAVNQTFDAQTLANAPSLLYPEDSQAAKILAEGFSPGLPLPYKESKDELGILKFPEPSANSFQMVNFFMSIVQRLTRTGPGQLGDISTGRRTPASLGLSIQQAGDTLTDEVIDRIRDTSGRVAERMMFLWHEDDPDVFERTVGSERGNLIRNVIQKAKDENRSVLGGIRVKLFASSATKNVETERQNAIAVSQLTFTWYKQAIELVQLFFTPGAPSAAQEVLLDVIKSSQEQLRRVVELSNMPDAARIVPDLAARLEPLIQSSQTAPPSPTGGEPPPPGSPPTGGSPIDVLQALTGGEGLSGGTPQGGAQDLGFGG